MTKIEISGKSFDRTSDTNNIYLQCEKTGRGHQMALWRKHQYHYLLRHHTDMSLGE